MKSTGYYNERGEPMTKEAFYALKGARIARQCGRYAAMRHALKHGVSPGLYRLAKQLVAMHS